MSALRPARASGKVTEAGGTTELAGIQIDTGATGGWGFGASTGDDGTYSMVVLPHRAYELAFHDDNGVYVNGCYADNPPGNFTADGHTCTPVTVGTSEVTEIDVSMPLAPQP